MFKIHLMLLLRGSIIRIIDRFSCGYTHQCSLHEFGYIELSPGSQCKGEIIDISFFWQVFCSKSVKANIHGIYN